MAMGKRTPRQQTMWVNHSQLPKGKGHPFYTRLNELLAKGGFDAWAENLCAPFFANSGRPSIPPGVYFRMLFIGYLEGFASDRAIAWNCQDRLSLRAFLGIALHESTPDHSSLTILAAAPESGRLSRGISTHLGLVMRSLYHYGTPREMADLHIRRFLLALAHIFARTDGSRVLRSGMAGERRRFDRFGLKFCTKTRLGPIRAFSTGC